MVVVLDADVVVFDAEVVVLDAEVVVFDVEVVVLDVEVVVLDVEVVVFDVEEVNDGLSDGLVGDVVPREDVPAGDAGKVIVTDDSALSSADALGRSDAAPMAILVVEGNEPPRGITR